MKPMHRIHHASPPTAQRGAALFTAMMILVAVTVLSLASLSTSLLEMRMSSNEELTMQAFELAQAGIDTVIANEDSIIKVTGDVGHTNCTANISGCNAYNINLTDPPFKTADANATTIKVERKSGETCPPRALSTSCNKQKAIQFGIESTVNKVEFGFGRADLEQGYMKMIPVYDQNQGNSPATATHN